ncbi:MAG: hypothetical protein ACM3ST_14440 [Bdellovibrio bacteriovorus]
MPLPSGDADKAGNRYELRWTVRQFIRLLTDETIWIELEPIGDEGGGIEFRLCRSDGRIEAYQVKRQQVGKAHRTFADLARAKVLEGLRKQRRGGALVGQARRAGGVRPAGMSRDLEDLYPAAVLAAVGYLRCLALAGPFVKQSPEER